MSDAPYHGAPYHFKGVIIMKIICKTTLFPAEARETRIRIRVDDPESLTWGMRTLELAAGCERAVVDWGDGTRQTVAESGELIHEYAGTGEYEVRISDDIASLSCASSGSATVYNTVYAPMIRAFRTTAARLEALASFCFFCASNLSAFGCAGSGLRTVGTRTFAKCPSLVGRLDLPGVEDIATTTFVSSAGITELHFSAAKEEAIRALPAWESSRHKFGAANATAYFDL